MKLTAREYISKAEGLKKTEINARLRLETIKARRRSVQSAIERQQYRLDSLRLELESLQREARHSDDPSRLEARIESVEASIQDTQDSIYNYRQEDGILHEKEVQVSMEIRAIEKQEQETLADIKDSATRTNKNIALMSSIGGDYANVSAQAAGSFRQNLNQLSVAASILGGNVPMAPSAPAISGTSNAKKKTPEIPVGTENFYERASAQRKSELEKGGSMGARGARISSTGRNGKNLYNTAVDDEVVRPKKLGGLGRKPGGALGRNNANIGNMLSNRNLGKGGFFSHLLGLRKKYEYENGNFEGFEVGPHFFVKGNSFDDFYNMWNGYDPSLFETIIYDSPEIIDVDPSSIEGIQLGPDDISNSDVFWQQHKSGGTKESFKMIAAMIPEVRERLMAGHSLGELINDKRLGACASIYFDPRNMIECIKWDGFYEFQSNGRHRALAARELGINIPVKVIGSRKRITTDDILFENTRTAGEEISSHSDANCKKNDVIATAFMSYGISSKVDFGNLDSRTSRDIFTAVAETKLMFPELDFRFVGSAQSRNRAIERDLREHYLDVYRKHYPGASDDELLPLVNQDVMDDMAGLQIGNNTIAQSMFVPSSDTFKESIFVNYNGITISENYGSDYEYFKKVKQQDVDAGWKPVNCNTPKATVDHELGHQVAKLLDAHNDPEIIDLYYAFMNENEDSRSQILSGYAAESIHEFIAEAWSEYRNNPECRDCARYVATRMIELYKGSNSVKVKTLRRHR